MSTAIGPAAGADLRTAAVVVNYESGSALTRCVEGLRSEGVAEIVVVDNGSLDGSVGQLLRGIPEVEVLVPGRNLGYGAAANRGVAATAAPCVLVCNPDLEVRAGAVAALAGALEDDLGCAVVGPLIRNPDGDRYPSARMFPSLVDAAGHALFGLMAPDNRFTRSYQKAHLDTADDAPRWSTGCREPAFWSGGPPTSRWGGLTRPTSCMPRTWICAGGWDVPDGGWSTYRPPK